MPFIAYTLEGSSAKLVPILVGALDVNRSGYSLRCELRAARCPCSLLPVIITGLVI